MLWSEKKKKQNLSCSLLPFLIVKCYRFASRKYLHHNYLKKRDPRLTDFVSVNLLAQTRSKNVIQYHIWHFVATYMWKLYLNWKSEWTFYLHRIFSVFFFLIFLRPYFLASSVLHTFPFNFYSFFTGWMNTAGIWKKKKHSTPHTIFNMKSVDISIENIGLTNFSSLS